MGGHRGILTDYERRCLAGEKEKKHEYQARSRVRSRINNLLAEDVEHLEAHDPDLLEELRDVVCPEE